MTSRAEELAVLIAEQEADDEWGHRVDAPRVPRTLKAVSLDYTLESGDTTGDTVGVDDRHLSRALAPEISGTRRIPRPQKWTRRQIVSVIRKWVKEHDEVPYYNDWNYPNGRGIPSAASLARHFGSFSEAIRAAGFEPRPKGAPTFHGSTSKRVPRAYKRRCTARFDSDQIAAAHLLYREGMSAKELSLRLWQKYEFATPETCSTELIRSFVVDGYPVRSKRDARLLVPMERRREIALLSRAVNAKLTVEQVREIRASKARQIDLAEKYDVSQTTISRIKRGIGWEDA